MKCSTIKEQNIRFFYENAGYSYNPETQTPEQGRQEYAKFLADAEQWAYDNEIDFIWDIDEEDSSSFSDDPEPWPLFYCIAIDRNGESLASVGAVDFGRDVSYPTTQPYSRVIEAELAAEVMAQNKATVCKEIKDFIFSNIETFRADAVDICGQFDNERDREEYGFLEITFAINDDWSAWNYQTGDNSYTGACYSLPHWAVAYIAPDTDASYIYESVLEELTALADA